VVKISVQLSITPCIYNVYIIIEVHLLFGEIRISRRNICFDAEASDDGCEYERVKKDISGPSRPVKPCGTFNRRISPTIKRDHNADIKYVTRLYSLNLRLQKKLPIFTRLVTFYSHSGPSKIAKSVIVNAFKRSPICFYDATKSRTIIAKTPNVECG
jgi:hypothetical protein